MLNRWLPELARLPQRLLIGLVQAYRVLLSPWLGSSCRFEPTCSAYALQALQRHGAAAGSYLAARRILRCHPWCTGGHDPVPARAPRLFTGGAPSPHDPPTTS
ncbi:hypothetical protein EDC36_1219 [Tepidimonas ignava]|uniref:Putative membrane protein insertion efficiency factor n=1 Tax=Tepidimonas ignava TaxID=114249 RepID=A0A4R3L4X2_9BURK|nr:hypothetical protein EDC36_1219 [Tepidimonas ignava]TSE18745.1 putative membrane protein insertion efficiency factor [Tepidimonas ignava]